MNKWLQLSILKHFTENIADLEIYIEGTERNTAATDNYCEIRIDGPDIRELSKGLFSYYCEINTLITTRMSKTSLTLESENLDKVLLAFTDIKVYRYGNAVADDKSYVGCLKLLPRKELRDRVKVSRFGKIQTNIDILQSTIEGSFEMLIGE